MIPEYLKRRILIDNTKFEGLSQESFKLPEYDPKTHYIELTRSAYFRALIVLRHYIKEVSDHYFGSELNAKNIDLFMLTASISSPMGPGSDSEAIPIRFGEHDSSLVDSSQFGFEPLLMNGLDKVYCYLPSMRGEAPDKRHLNQFFHCEAEIRGTLGSLLPIVEGYIKILSETLLQMPALLKGLSLNHDETRKYLEKIIVCNNFPVITFDEAVEALIDGDYKELVNFTPLGRDIVPEGELMLADVLGLKTPFWIKNYDRDRVAFYQKPCHENPDKVINADLIFPRIIKGSFGGEIAGCGQRQDDPNETIESLDRQGISSEHYEWYIDLRRLPNYQTTSGFGLGIERFIAWCLCRDDIKNVIPYPRLKNIKTYP
jgi:asparaginyl-tRNA synthetase